MSKAQQQRAARRALIAEVAVIVAEEAVPPIDPKTVGNALALGPNFARIIQRVKDLIDEPLIVDTRRLPNADTQFCELIGMVPE